MKWLAVANDEGIIKIVEVEANTYNEVCDKVAELGLICHETMAIDKET